MKLKKILITGGAGFIGSHTADHLIDCGYEVRILDNLNPQIHPDQNIPAYLNKKAQFLKGDVTSREDWEKALEKIDVVIHFGAAVGVGQSMYQVEHYVKSNSLGAAILLDILANKKHTVKKMIIAASMVSFGEGLYKCPSCQLMQQPPLRKIENLEKHIWEPLCQNCNEQLKPIPTPEDAKRNGPSIYGITKKNQEDMFFSIGKAYQIPTVALRFFNAFGTRQSLSNPYCGVAAIFLSRVKNNQPPIINEDGLQTRDFVYIDDITNAIQLSLEKEEADYEAFNIGSGVPITIKQVADEVISLNKSNLKPEITFNFRNFDVRHCFADVSKAKKILGWEPRVTFTNGLQKVFNWSKNENAIDHMEESISELKKRNLI